MKRRSEIMFSNKSLISIGLAVAGIVLCVGLVFWACFLRSGVTPVSTFDDGEALEIRLLGEDTTIEVFSEYVDQGAQVYYDSEVVDAQVKVSGEVDTSKLGKYTLVYESTYNGENADAQRVVEVVDLTPPEIKAPDEVIFIPGKEAEFTYSAEDNYDGTIDSGAFTLEKSGEAVILTVSDSSGNKSSKSVKLKGVEDNDAPVLTLKGDIGMSVKKGSEFADPGATAIDSVFGDLTSFIKVEGQVDTSVSGSYILTYSVSDPAGNTAKAIRTVIVYPAVEGNGPTSQAGVGKTVYLTFDDGPCGLTSSILRVLAEYDVKATFFVTAQSRDYIDQIGEAYRQGHAIGVHTLTHDFAIYTSPATYFDDLLAMEEIVKEQTGSYTDIIRFPGGSSNTISRNYCVGIMSQLADMVEDQGYSYHDWNVGSNDTGTNDPEVIYQNVINGIAERNTSVVLMHDIKQATYEALPRILEYCIDNGYSFGVLSSDGPVIHHGISN